MFRLNKESASKRSFSSERDAQTLSCREGGSLLQFGTLEKKTEYAYSKHGTRFAFLFPPANSDVLGEKNE